MQPRLAFYSDQEIPENTIVNRRLLSLIGVEYPRIGYISSALDPTRSYFSRKQSYYRALGCDLCVYLDSDIVTQPDLVRRLLDCDAVHMTGGNTFSFLHWLQQHDMLTVSRTYATQRGVLIGASAGSLLMTKSIALAEISGDTPDPSMTSLEALGLVDFFFWPHYLPGAERKPGVSAVLAPSPLVYACRDGAGVIVDGPRVELFGEVTAFRYGHINAA